MIAFLLGLWVGGSLGLCLAGMFQAARQSDLYYTLLDLDPRAEVQPHVVTRISL